MLGNSSQGLLPLQKHLLYHTCILPIATYGFQLWFFKGLCMSNNIKDLNKMQWRAALWITGAFKTAPLAGIEAIVGLIPITLYLKKLNGHHHLHYASIPRNHAVNSLLDSQHAKNVSSHKFALSNLTDKQKTKLKSPISDINNRLSEINDSFIPFHFIFLPGLRLVDHFSKKFPFILLYLQMTKNYINTSII